jgi:hypothetical protein
MSINQWPCIPDQLSDFMDSKMIRFVSAGLSEEYGLPMSIIEPNGVRYDPYDLMQKYRPFCKFARFHQENDQQVFIGFDEKCRDWDKSIACTYLDNPNNILLIPYPQPCWMKLLDYIVLEETGRHRYAIFTGQYIQETNDGSGVQIVEAEIDKWTKENKFQDQQKITDLKKLLGEHSNISKESEDKIRDFALSIDQIFDQYWRRHKDRVEDEILRNLYNNLGQIKTIGQELDWVNLDSMMEDLRLQLGCSHILVFAAETRQINQSKSDHSNVLALRSSAGLPVQNRNAPPHFNWHKAGCSSDGLIIFDPSGADPAWKKCIRCDNVPEPPPSSVLCALGDEIHGMRCVVVLGAINGLEHIKGAKDFLVELLNRFCERIQHLMLIASLEHSEETLREERDFLVHQVNSRLTTFEDYQKAVESNINKTDFQVLELYHETFIKAREDLVDHAQFVQRGLIQFRDPSSLKLVSTNIIPILEAALDEKEIRAEAAQIDIYRQFEPASPPLVKVDVFWLKTIFIHLLDNAIKYSRPPQRGGRRWIAVRANPTILNLVVEVENFGLGILQEHLRIIFDKSARIVGGTRFEKKPGMGRGLFEARSIAHAMGAEIKVSSRHHKGGPVTKGQINECITCFRIIIPLARRNI